MWGSEKLSTSSTEGCVGHYPVEKSRTGEEAKQEGDEERGVTVLPSVEHDEPVTRSPPSSPSPKTRKASKKRSLSVPAGPVLYPMPTIETIMKLPSLSRPTYNSFIRGEPPAQTYNTVVRSPKPASIRAKRTPRKSTLDILLMRAAELQATERQKKRSRSSSNSSYTTAYSAGESESSTDYDGDSESGDMDEAEPPSPTVSEFSSRATAASSPRTSPGCSPSPPTSPVYALESDFRSPSPVPSLRSSISTLPSLKDFASSSSSSSSPADSSHSLASSATSSEYLSASGSPELSRRSSSGEEFMAYPSPPTSPPTSSEREEGVHREITPFTSPRDAPAPPTPTILRGSLSPSSSDGAAKNDPYLNWDLDGGNVVFGAAGVALSPRTMRGGCHRCGCRGLGLYVIDEEDDDLVELEA